MKTYKLSDNSTGDKEQQTIIVTEEKTTITEAKITVAQMKQRYKEIVSQMEYLRSEANNIVDELGAIDSNIPDINIPSKPDKIPSHLPEWSSFESHEFQQMEVGTKVTDEGTIYQLTNPGQGHRKPSGQHGHHGWSAV